MSRNPYLAASRPSSSFTRSSRTSKRNDLPSSRGSLLGRSRSSASLGVGYSSDRGASSLYSSNYTPTWQRSTSSTRSNRSTTDPSNSSSASTYKADDYTPSSSSSRQRQFEKQPEEPSNRSSSSLYKSRSNLSQSDAVADSNDDDKCENDSDHGKEETVADALTKDDVLLSRHLTLELFHNYTDHKTLTCLHLFPIK